MNTRKLRTRTLIQLGGLVQKSGLMDALNISPGDDLQEYENLPKASQVLGFLIEASESQSFNDDQINKWGYRGEASIRYEPVKSST